jgi:hypothetical protein
MIDKHYPQPRPDPSNGSLPKQEFLPAVFAVIY